MSEKALTVKEIAEALRVTSETVRAWMKSGVLEAFQLPSGDWRAWPSAVEALADRGRNAPAPQAEA